MTHPIEDDVHPFDEDAFDGNDDHIDALKDTVRQLVGDIEFLLVLADACMPDSERLKEIHARVEFLSNEDFDEGDDYQ